MKIENNTKRSVVIIQNILNMYLWVTEKICAPICEFFEEIARSIEEEQLFHSDQQFEEDEKEIEAWFKGDE